MFAAYAAGTAVGAVPWRKLLPDWARPSWGATLTSRFAASGINALLPFFGLGEASRLLWLPRGERSPGLAALVVDRLLFLAAGMPILVIAALAATRVPAVPHSYLLAVLDQRERHLHRGCRGRRRRRARPPGRQAALGADHVRRPAHRRHRQRRARRRRPTDDGAVDPVDRGLHSLLTGARAPLAGGFALHICARLLLAAEIYAGLRILGAPVGVLGTLIFIAIPVGLSVIGTFVPGQIGLQEGASALVAAALGIGPATGIALVFLQRLRQLVFVPLAGLLIALVPYGPRSSDPPGRS